MEEKVTYKDKKKAERRNNRKKYCCCWKIFHNLLGVSIDVEEDSKFEMVYLQGVGEKKALTEVDVKRLEEFYRYGDLLQTTDENEV